MRTDGRLLPVLALVLLVLSLPGAAGSAGQERTRLTAFVGAVERVTDVAWRLRTANAELCGGRARWSHGIAAGTVWDLPSGIQAAAETVLGFDDRMRVLAVAKGSPAALAGIRAGDVVAAIDGQPMGTKPSVAQLRVALDKATLVLELRGGDGLTRPLSLDGRRACDVDAQVLEKFLTSAAPSPNAATLAIPMLVHADTDDDLAFLLAHDLAHVLLDHFRRKSDANAAGPVIGTLLFGSPIGGNPLMRPFAAEQEVEADILTVHLMRRAGYDGGGLPDLLAALRQAYAQEFQSHCAAAHPCNHPISEARIEALRALGAAAPPGDDGTEAAQRLQPPSRKALADFVAGTVGTSSGPERGLLF
jgi:hypothetical protein